MNSANELISVCICTFKRPNLLKTLLNELSNQTTDNQFKFEVVIVDNDPSKSGEPIFREFKSNSTLDVFYDFEPERSISLARNRSIKNAKGDYIAFIDDDEFPKNDWLLQMLKCLKHNDVDGVLGPVNPYIDENVPKWLEKSGLIHRRRFETGYILKNSSHTRTGNVLLKSALVKNEETPFDPKYGKIGGGDVDFFHRMMKRNKVFIWCDDAIVYEFISPDRREKKYYLKRSFTRGVTNSWKVSFLSTSTLKSFIAIPSYALIIPFCAVLGQHLLMKYTVKFCDHFGKLIGYAGIKLVKERPY
jgi:glycosyltransferase involved in cell wall biosynthesis